MIIKYLKIITTIVILAHFANSISAQNNSWTLKKNENGIIVHTRENKTTGYIEFKASITIKTTIDTLQKVLKDIEGYTKWMTDTKKSSVLKKVNSTEQYIYIEAQLPWPLENRDIPMYQKFSTTSKGVKITLIGKPLYIPYKQNITRIEKANGSWELIQLPNNQVEVIYQFMSYSGLNIPNWVINLFIVDGPLHTLTNLKSIVEH